MTRKPTRDGLRAALEDRYDVYVAEDAKAAMELLERENLMCCSRIFACRTRTA